MVHPLFTAAVLEGMEGTLEELKVCVEGDPELRTDLDVLQSRIAELRISLEEQALP